MTDSRKRKLANPVIAHLSAGQARSGVKRRSNPRFTVMERFEIATPGSSPTLVWQGSRSRNDDNRLAGNDRRLRVRIWKVLVRVLP